MEELLAEQLLFHRGRSIALSCQVAEATDPVRTRVIHGALDGVAKNIRKLAHELNEWRRPQRQCNTLVAIGQANVAGQQVIHNQPKPPGAPDGEQR